MDTSVNCSKGPELHEMRWNLDRPEA